jgi:hypothetical protein
MISTLVHQLCFAQSDSVIYTKGLVFKDGIYMSYQDFKNNKPSLTPQNFKIYNPEMDYLGKSFFMSKGFTPKKIKFPFSPDSVGAMYVDSIFGFCVDGIPYVTKDLQQNSMARIVNGRYKLMLYRFFKIGKLCLIYPEKKELKYNRDTVNSKKSVSVENEDPFSGISFLPDSINMMSMNMGGFSIPYKAKLYFLSFDTGKIYKFKREKFSMLLEKKDKELFDEYSKFSKSKQEDMMFIYLTKLNEKHPVYFSR